jgi:hypothetical protein
VLHGVAGLEQDELLELLPGLLDLLHAAGGQQVVRVHGQVRAVGHHEDLRLGVEALAVHVLREHVGQELAEELGALSQAVQGLVEPPDHARFAQHGRWQREDLALERHVQEGRADVSSGRLAPLHGRDGQDGAHAAGARRGRPEVVPLVDGVVLGDDPRLDSSVLFLEDHADLHQVRPLRCLGGHLLVHPEGAEALDFAAESAQEVVGLKAPLPSKSFHLRLVQLCRGRSPPALASGFLRLLLCRLLVGRRGTHHCSDASPHRAALIFCWNTRCRPSWCRGRLGRHHGRISWRSRPRTLALLGVHPPHKPLSGPKPLGPVSYTHLRAHETLS